MNYVSNRSGTGAVVECVVSVGMWDSSILCRISRTGTGTVVGCVESVRLIRGQKWSASYR